MAKKKCPEFENHERWLVSYADMVTLLFAVFVVLFALKEGGDAKNNQTAGSMQESFNTPLEDIPADRRKGPSEQGFGIFDHYRGDRVLPPLVKRYPSIPERTRIIDSEMDKFKAQLEVRFYGPNRHRLKKATGQARIVSVERTPKGFKVRMLARHFFKSGSAKMSPAALSDLDTIIKPLKELGRTLTVEGHTDSLPPKDQSNWDLSIARASYVLQYLIRKHHFPSTKLRAAGYADTRPIAHNGSERGRMLNRRIEIHVDYEDK